MQHLTGFILDMLERQELTGNELYEIAREMLENSERNVEELEDSLRSREAFIRDMNEKRRKIYDAILELEGLCHDFSSELAEKDRIIDRLGEEILDLQNTTEDLQEELDDAQARLNDFTRDLDKSDEGENEHTRRMNEHFSSDGVQIISRVNNGIHTCSCTGEDPDEYMKSSDEIFEYILDIFNLTDRVPE